MFLDLVFTISAPPGFVNPSNGVCFSTTTHLTNPSEDHAHFTATRSTQPSLFISPSPNHRRGPGTQPQHPPLHPSHGIQTTPKPPLSLLDSIAQRGPRSFHPLNSPSPLPLSLPFPPPLPSPPPTPPPRDHKPPPSQHPTRSVPPAYASSTAPRPCCTCSTRWGDGAASSPPRPPRS